MKKRFIGVAATALTLLVSSLHAAVVINEVFYDPPGTDTEAADREFVELYNNGPDPVYVGYKLLQIAGPHWKTTNVILPGAIIPGYSYLLIAEGETFGVTPDLIASLGLQNGNYQAYYDDQWHTFTSPIDGVRLVSGDGSIVHDCLLYNDGELGNQHNLETDGAAVDGFCQDVPSGCSISRVTAGYDSNYLSDWETLSEPTPTARGPLLDSDNDGLLDVIENYIGSNPQLPDSDGDGLLDGEEMRSGYLGVGPNETFPLNPDSDDDGLWDGLEVNTYYSKPRKPDTDGDGLEDGPEVYAYGTLPTNPDSDFDGYPDGWEVTYGTDPGAFASRPGVVINEVYYDHPGSDDRMEYITLYNPEFYDVDISYFRVDSAGPSFQRNLTFPAGTVLPAGCFFLVGEEDAVDMNGNPPDLISWLDLQNGDQNDPDAYYYGAQSPTDGVRLTGPKEEGPAIAIDTILWGGPNSNNLPGDASDPATADELIPDISPGQALRRGIVGYDTNHKSDWAAVVPAKASSSSGQDPDGDGLTNYEEASLGTDALNPDHDGDGVADGDEYWHGYDPLDPDSVPSSVPDAVIRNFPIRSGDFNGDGIPDISIFRPASGLWAVKNLTRVYFGTSGDIPQPGDYDGNGTTDITIFRPSIGLWAVKNLTRVYFGNQTDLPVSGDYNGTGTGDIGIFRPSTGLWAIRNLTRIYFGTSGDIPAPAEYGCSPLHSDNIAIFRPSNGLWAIRGLTRVYYGRALDVPVPEACPTSMVFQAIFRARGGLWAIRGVSRIYYGSLGDLPVTAKWAPQKTVGIFRPASGLWAIRNHTRTYFGGTNDMPIPMLYRGTDSDCDGLPDWWEEQYFGDLGWNPQDDYDADGVSNFDEYRNGTDPNDQRAYWTMDECGGFSIYDATENDNDGAIQGANWSANASGCALSFDGVTDYVDCGNDASLHTEYFTVSAWINHEPYTASGDAVLGNSKWSGGHFTEGYVMRFWGSDNSFKYILGSAGSDRVIATSIPLQRWIHVAMSYDGTTFRAYKNGALAGSLATSDYTEPTRSLWIGRDHTDSGMVYYNGMIDEVRAYNRALSPAEIADLYDSDGDTLPDTWEMYYFGDLAQNSQGNPDRDGCNNIAEYEAGTDPTVRDCGPTPTPTPDYIEPVFPPSSSSGDSVPYIIITNDALKNAGVYPNFQTLLFHRIARGMRGGIVTTEQIVAEYDGIRPDGGVDLQTKIRQFIKDAYDNWETDYVLLGGDEYVIPPRYFYVWSENGYPPPNPRGSNHVPADIYYGCIYAVGGYCDFDHNANGWYGETVDGVGGGEVDLLFEVNIGRSPLKNSDDLSNFIGKTITYETVDDPYLHKILSTAITYGKDRGDVLLFGTGNIAGMHKLPFFNKLESTFSAWSGMGNLSKINDSDDYNHMIFDMAHAGNFSGMGIHTASTGISPNLGTLENALPFFANVGGCKSGSFDYSVGPAKRLASFTDYPYGLAIGDFNHLSDGHLDLVASFQNENTLKMGYGNGDGTFQPFQTIASSVHGISGPTWLIKEYFNPDEHWDFATVNSGGSSFSVMNSNGAGSYDVATYNLPEAPFHLASIDFDGDNDADLAVTTASNSMGIYLFWNNNGNFSRHTDMELPWEEIEERAVYVVSGNFTGDNHADLAVTSDADKVYLLFGGGNGSFSEYTSFHVGSVPKYIASGDFNQDGLDDIVVSCRGSEYVTPSSQTDGFNSELWNFLSCDFSPGSFSIQTYTKINNLNYVLCEDLNNDGFVDVIATETNELGGCGFGVYLGSQMGRMIPNRGGYGGLDQANSVVVGDIDGDGQKDIIVSKATTESLYKSLSRERDCFTEEIVNIEYGAFASVGAAYVNGGDYYGAQLVDAFVREYNNHLGDAFADSKEDNIGQGGITYWRPHHFYLNLFGDPAVRIRFSRYPLILGGGDFDGDGTSDIATFNNNQGLWSIRGITTVFFGDQECLPVCGDYDGDGTTDITVFNKVNALWKIRNISQLYFGHPGVRGEYHYYSSEDMPVPGDYDGDGTTDVAVYRPSEGLWSIRDRSSFQFGGHMDIPVILDYSGDGSDDIAVFQLSEGSWRIRGITMISFGSAGDIPVPGDYSGDGSEELAVYRPSSNLWIIRNITSYTVGDTETYYSIPVPADYDGDGIADIAIFNAADGRWVIRDQTQVYFGGVIDFPVSGKP